MLHPQPLKSAQKNLWPFRALLFICFGLLMVFTRPLFLGDTHWYILDIENSFGHSLLDSHKLWDFPHLFWRPIGRILSDLLLPYVLPHFQKNTEMAITFLYICLNILAAFVAALLIQTAAWRLTQNRAAATLAAVAFLCGSTMLNYSRSGSSYVFGVTFLLLAFYLSGFSSSRSWRAAVLCGLCLSVSVLVWVPYLVSIPAVILAGPVLNLAERSERNRHLNFILISSLVAGVMIAMGYAVALEVQHIRSVPALLQWIHETSHDPERNRKLMRMATGFPRSVFELGDVARWIKWYLFHDPYANVGLGEMLRVPLLKLVTFYSMLGGLAIALCCSSMGRRWLALIAIAMIPNLGMALFYESGSPERYLPFLPLIYIGFGYVMGSNVLQPWARILLAILCCAPIPINLTSMSSTLVHQKYDSAATSIAELSALPPGSHVYVINGFDDRSQLDLEAPFNDIHQKPHPEMEWIMPVLGSSVPLWKKEIARTAIKTWDHAGQIWVTTRVLSERPQRSWAWIEGDDRRMTWSEIYKFFQSFDHSETTGGPDGFFKIKDTPQNRRTMEAVSVSEPIR